jgi:hypothetical protein
MAEKELRKAISYHVGNPATLPFGSRPETLRPPLSESLPFSVVTKVLIGIFGETLILYSVAWAPLFETYWN